MMNDLIKMMSRKSTRVSIIDIGLTDNVSHILNSLYEEFENDDKKDFELEDLSKKIVPRLKPKFMKELNKGNQETEERKKPVKKKKQTQKLLHRSRKTEVVIHEKRSRKKTEQVSIGQQISSEQIAFSLKFLKRRSDFTTMISHYSIAENIQKELKINGNRIIGSWNNKQELQGFVKIQYQSGDMFRGYYQNGIRRKGIFQWVTGERYEGQFWGQKIEGIGRFIACDGKVIQGTWTGGVIDGQATILYPNKDVYYGKLDEKFKKHYFGHYFFHHGQKYVGNFQHGHIQGHGSLYDENDICLSRGIWRKGQLIQQTTNEYHSSSPSLKYRQY